MDFTSKILFPKWKLEKGEIDFTILRVIVEGEKKKRKNYAILMNYLIVMMKTHKHILWPEQPVTLLRLLPE